MGMEDYASATYRPLLYIERKRTLFWHIIVFRDHCYLDLTHTIQGYQPSKAMILPKKSILVLLFSIHGWREHRARIIFSASSSFTRS